LDAFNRGYVTCEDLQLGDCFDKNTFDIHADPREIFKQYDLDRNGFIDEDEFLHMMCPLEYRYIPQGQDDAECEGQLLMRWISHRRASAGSILTKDGDFSGYSLVHRKTLEDVEATTTPKSLLPYPPEDVLASWRRAFKRMASAFNNDASCDYIDVGTLKKLGVVSDDTAITLVETIDTRSSTGFTCQGFIEAMCEAHEYQVPPDILLSAAAS
jgi:hypothetical protein